MPLIDGELVISNSEIQTLLQCKRKWYLAWNRSLTPAFEEVTGIRSIGSRIHQVFEAYYTPDGGQDPSVIPSMLRAVQTRDLNTMVMQYGNPDEVPEHVMKDWLKSTDLENAMVTGYVEWLEETGEDADLEITATEQRVKAPIEAPGVPVPVFLIGRLDVRGRRVSDGRRVFIDHKTVAEFTTIEAQLPMDPQMLHYMLLESLAAPDEPRTSLALYNMLRRVKRTGTAKPPFYKRVVQDHNEHELLAYTRKVQAAARDLWHLYSNLEAGVQHHDIAYASPGKDCSWKCDFNRLCPMMDDGSRADDYIRDEFKVVNLMDRYDHPRDREGE